MAFIERYVLAKRDGPGLRRRDVDPLRSRIRVIGTVQIRGVVTLDNEPKTTRSRRTIPVARPSVMARIEQHLDKFVGIRADDLVFTAPTGGLGR
jgi:hypothetical protein